MNCKPWKGKPFKLPPMPNYPQERIIESKTFGRIGLDHLGPVAVKTQTERVKRWIVLFTSPPSISEKRLLTERELITLIIEVESILNTRPLIYVNFDDSIILRPTDYFTQCFIPNDNDDNEDEFTSHKLTTQDYLDTDRNRYQLEYKSPKNVERRAPIGVVLSDEPYTPRGTWKLARIKKLNVAVDGHVSSAQIKTPLGKLNRPVNTLYPL
ncbi:unnamed protein product, partial [Acanthocheilonema viteae]